MIWYYQRTLQWYQKLFSSCHSKTLLYPVFFRHVSWRWLINEREEFSFQSSLVIPMTSKWVQSAPRTVSLSFNTTLYLIKLVFFLLRLRLLCYFAVIGIDGVVTSHRSFSFAFCHFKTSTTWVVSHEHQPWRPHKICRSTFDYQKKESEGCVNRLLDYPFNLVVRLPKFFLRHTPAYYLLWIQRNELHEEITLCTFVRNMAFRLYETTAVPLVHQDLDQIYRVKASRFESRRQEDCSRMYEW